MLLTRADSDDLEGVRIGPWPVDQPEPRRSVAGEVELDPGQPGQITTNVAAAEEFAGDPAVREVVEGGPGRVQPFVAEGFEIGLDGGVEGQLVTSGSGRALSHEGRGRAGARSSR